MRKFESTIISFIAICWALFQLLLPRLIILDSIQIRAIHLAFAVCLVFLTVPLFRPRGKESYSGKRDRIPPWDYVLAVVSTLAVLYIVFDWEGIAGRAGLPILRDIIVSLILILLLLEASRRVIGPALSVIVVLFSIYAFFGPYMPSFLAFKGVSVTKYITQVALSTEGIYGIPLDVSATTVFLFVLFGAILEKVGAGRFFNDLAISLFGRFKGGPAKAAVVSSGLTGIVSGSSIANVVTTGTFSIPLMKKVGYPARIAAATEVAASTNGQLMPPIMGAAAFIIAEYLGISYLAVVKAAALPAVVSYFALFYITHLEASKLGMKGLQREDIPPLGPVLKNGFFYLIPVVVLLYEMVFMRHSPNLSVFNAIVSLALLVLLREIIAALRNKAGIKKGLGNYFRIMGSGLEAGSRNMLSVALATATAGIVVGIVTMGIGGMIVQVVEVLSLGNILLLLFVTALASLVLGMGLPTTATYIVMASITVPVIIKLSTRFGMNPIPAIAAHLFCFYFGILADDTPPVGLAAYTASAIAKSDPIKTGIQGFVYDLRTAIIPFAFVFNPELLLLNVNNIFHFFLIFSMATLGAFAFTNAVQGWFVTKNRWYEVPIFLGATIIFFYPATLTKILGWGYDSRYFMYLVALFLYAAAFIIQKSRMRSNMP